MTTPVIRTLVVDDDYRVAKVHAAYVARIEGFVVVGQAHSAIEALRAVSDRTPDLVLMDVFLPDGDGLTLVQTLMAQDRHPDVIVVTASRDLTTVRRAMQLGAVHYLVKPFGFAALNERLVSYRRLRVRLDRQSGDAAQADVDELFRMLRAPGLAGSRPEKGHSGPTLELVLDAVRTAESAMSAAEIGETIGVSRATAQRYLNYLERNGLVRLQLRYGTTGRPEHEYAPV